MQTLDRLDVDTAELVMLYLDKQDLDSLAASNESENIQHILGLNRFWKRKLQQEGLAVWDHSNNWKKIWEDYSAGHNINYYTMAKNYDVVRLLILNGAIQEDLSKALITTSLTGDIEMAVLLIDNGADLQYRNSAALVTANKLGHHNFVTLLIDRGASKTQLEVYPYRYRYSNY